MGKYTPQFSLEEIFRQQGVKAGSLDKWLSGPWSDGQDEEVNAFLAMRRESRSLPHREIDDEAALVPAK